MFKEVEGDLFESDAGVLAHGCNTYGIMGRGIAPLFKDRWPAMYQEYAIVCKSSPKEEIWGTSWLWFNPKDGPNIACLFTQHEWAAEPTYIEYAFLELLDQMVLGGMTSVAFPAIGCGVAKTGDMDLDVLRDICRKVFGDSEIDATLYIKPPDPELDMDITI